MRHPSIRTFVALCALLLSAGCGGGTNSATALQGPILSLDEIQLVAVDQLFVNGGVQDEFSGRGKFAIYLRDTATQKDIACTRATGGDAKVVSPAIYYGGLSMPLVPLEGDHPSSVARFQIVFVSKNGPDCPAPIDATDTVVGISGEATADQLLRTPIWAENGRGVAVLRGGGDSPLSVRAMAPALVTGLFIDEIFFKGSGDGTPGTYYVFAERLENGATVSQCQLDALETSGILSGDVIYAAMGIALPCIDPADPLFPSMQVRVGLYVQTSSGPQLVGETAPAAVIDIVGEQVPFTNGDGSVTFQRVTPAFYGSAVVRLADLASTAITRVAHTASPSTTADVELHAVAGDSGLSVACAGAAQGLTGIAPAGTHENLAATMVAVDGQRELFGWDQVVLKLVERADGRACPMPPGAGAKVLAQTSALGSSDLKSGAASFLQGGGDVAFLRAVAGSN